MKGILIFLKCQLFQFCFKSEHFSITCKNVGDANSPFSPISSLPDTWTWHGDWQQTLSQQTSSNECPVSECLDKTQIRGYSRDTPANNKSYLHTRVMSDTGLAGHYCHTVTLGMIRDNCLVTMFDSYYPESTQGRPIRGLCSGSNPTNHCHLKLFSQEICLLVIIKCQ